jgi:Phospholipase_D-nuclease N-terminal
MPTLPPQFLIPLLIIIPLVIFWAWMFRDMMNNDSLPDDTKNTWTLLFVLLNVFGAGLYFINVYRDRN